MGKSSKLKNTITKTLGFTLVELLLVVGIIGIVAGIGGDMFATVVRAYRRAELFSYTEQVGNNILTSIEQDLRSASSVNINPSGNSIKITIPTASGNVTRTYTFTSCTSPSYLGNVNMSVGAGAPESIFSSPTNNTFFNTRLYVNKIGSANYFSSLKDSTGRYSIVTVSFTVFTGNTGNPCTTPSNRDTESHFITSVNLRGGI